jgi:putative phage-type endonuclease
MRYKIHNVEQRTPEWHQLRKGSIGGTGTKGIFAKNNLPLLDEVIANKHASVIDEVFVNQAMQRGIDLEPIAKANFESYERIKVDEVGMITNEDLKGFHISPDGVIMDNGIITKAIEIKCPSTKKHVEYIRTGKVPSEYKYQIMHYFAMIDTLKSIYFISFDDRFEPMPLHYIEVDRNEEEVQEYKLKLLEFQLKLEKYENQIFNF